MSALRITTRTLPRSIAARRLQHAGTQRRAFSVDSLYKSPAGNVSVFRLALLLFVGAPLVAVPAFRLTVGRPTPEMREQGQKDFAARAAEAAERAKQALEREKKKVLGDS